MTTQFIVATTFGLAATATGIIKFQIPSRRGLLRINALTGLLICVQFIFLGCPSGAAMAAASGSTSLVSAEFGEKLPIWARPAAGLLAIAVLYALGDLGARHIWEWLPIGAFVIGRVAETFRDQRRVRSVFLLAHVLWFVYGAKTLAIGTMLTEVGTFTSNMVGLYRLRKANWKAEVRAG